MSYAYEPITTYFKPTIWSEDVSTSVDPEDKAEEQLKSSFGLIPTYDWKLFKESIEGKYILAYKIADLVELSAKCSKGESIKVIYLARHGHGKSPSYPFLVHESGIEPC